MNIDEVMRVANDFGFSPLLRHVIEQHVAEAVAGERVTVLDEVLRGLRSERDTDQLRAIIAEVEAIRARGTT